VKGPRGGIHLFTVEEKQLYKRKNTFSNIIYYECCREGCIGGVKQVNDILLFHKEHSKAHADQEQDFLVLLFRKTITEEAIKNPFKQQHLIFEEVRHGNVLLTMKKKSFISLSTRKEG
jgi:hypothetical protein